MVCYQRRFEENKVDCKKYLIYCSLDLVGYFKLVGMFVGKVKEKTLMGKRKRKA